MGAAEQAAAAFLEVPALGSFAWEVELPVLRGSLYMSERWGAS